MTDDRSLATPSSKSKPIDSYGDRDRLIDFASARDMVKLTILAMGAMMGRVYNIGSGHSTCPCDAINLIEAKAAKWEKIKCSSAAAGDARLPSSDISRVPPDLGCTLSTSQEVGTLGRLGRTSARDINAVRRSGS